METGLDIKPIEKVEGGIYPNSIIVYKRPGSSDDVRLVSGSDAANIEDCIDGSIYDPNDAASVSQLPGLENILTTSDGYTVYGFATGKPAQWRFVYASNGRDIIMPCDIVASVLLPHTIITIYSIETDSQWWSLEVTITVVAGVYRCARYVYKPLSDITAKYLKTVVDRDGEVEAVIDFLQNETGLESCTDIDHLVRVLRNSKQVV